MIADAAGNKQAQFMIRGMVERYRGTQELFEQGIKFLFGHEGGTLDNGKNFSGRKSFRIHNPAAVKISQQGSVLVEERNGFFQIAIGHRMSGEFLQPFTKPGELLKQIGAGALRVQFDGQDNIPVKRKAGVFQPNIREALDGIAGVGKNRPIQELQVTAQGGLKAALNERTTVALEMFGSERNRGRCTQDPDGQKAGGMDEFFRSIRAKITENPIPGPGFPGSKVIKRIRGSLLEFVQDRFHFHSPPRFIEFAPFYRKMEEASMIFYRDEFIEKQAGLGLRGGN